MIIVVVVVLATACAASKPSTQVVYSSHLTSLGEIITRGGVTLDTSVSRDGHGVIRVDSTGPMMIQLAEIHPPDTEGVTLIYRGHLRTQNLRGRAYLEMRCDILGNGESVSRILQSPVSGTSDWVSEQTQLVVERGEHVQTIKLNVAVEGVGTVWIGPILLSQAAVD